MRKKIFTILLALAASVGMMNAKVTWNSSNISDLSVFGTYESYSKEGVTLSANGEDVRARWDMDGITFRMYGAGGFTFSNTLGKNFTKIEMTLNGPGGWNYANLGSDWLFNWNYGEESVTFTVTWKGNASKVVNLLEDASEFHGDLVKSIVFYFEGDSEEPDPTPKYYVVGTMNSWQVNEAYEMTRNNSAETEEYMFTLDLTTEDQFKVKKVVGENEIWYPDGTGNNYGQNGEIKEDGNYTIYFRPNGDGGDDWFYHVIYVAKNGTTAIDQLENGKCENVKMIIDGQLLILRDGKTYNAQGALVK